MFFILYLLWLILVAVIGAMIAVFRFIREQRAINEAIADYVEADQQKTWEASAEALVRKIRGAKDVDNSNS